MVSPGTSLLFVENLRKHFPIGIGFPPWQPAAHVRAVDNISFDVSAGETLGVVGESGCGKSTMARLLIHLIEPDTGDIKLGQKTEFRFLLCVAKYRWCSRTVMLRSTHVCL